MVVKHVRPYHESDVIALSQMLKSEGLKDEELYRKHGTWIFGNMDGFMTIKIDENNNIPHLQHFYLKPLARTADNARALIRSFCERVRAMGSGYAIIHVPDYRANYLNKLVRYYFKKAPYARKDGYSFYLVEV